MLVYRLQKEAAMKPATRQGFIKLATIFKARFTEAEVSGTSVIIAYYLLLSMFPLTIAVGNILPLFGLSAERVMPYIHTLVPLSVQPVLDPIITSLLTSTSGGLLSISAIGLLWSASRGVAYLQRGMNKAYGVKARGGFVIKRGISVVVVLLVLLLLIAFIIVYSFGQSILIWLEQYFDWAVWLDQTLGDIKWPATFVFLFALLMLVYRIVPDVRLRLREVWPGALLGTVGVALLTQLFTLYMWFATRSFSSYDALGAVFVLMFWLNFSAVIILLGAVLNASLHEYKHGPAETQNSRIDDFLFAKGEQLLNHLKQRRAEKKRKKQAGGSKGPQPPEKKN